MQELEYLSTKIIFNARKQEVYEEVAKLVQFLHSFAMREVGDDTIPEEFVGKFLRCSIKIVSTVHVRSSGKTQGPAKRVAKAFEKGIENVYIIGPLYDGGKDFIESVCNHPVLDEARVVRVRAKTFEGIVTKKGYSTPTRTYMVQLQNNSDRKFISDRDIYRTIEEYREEIGSEENIPQKEPVIET